MRPSEGGSYVLRDGKLVRVRPATAEAEPQPADASENSPAGPAREPRKSGRK